MSRHTLALAFLLGGLGAMLVPSLPRAEEKKAVEGGKKLTSKSESYTPASTIDFSGSLGLSFDSLSSLGSRIDQARKAADPVGLASASLELGAAEKASGKKAPITAESLEKGALELAKLRAHSSELKAMRALLKDKDLDDQIQAAESREADEAKDFKSGARKKGATYLSVNNYHEYTVNIYVDGQYVGQVFPNGEFTFTINKKFNAVNLVGTGPGVRFGPTFIPGNYDKYTWNLE